MVFTLKNFCWFVGYALVLFLVVFLLNSYRTEAIANYSTSDAQQDWQVWRESAEEVGQLGSVKRSKPASAEPPSLVLMRDHYPSIVGISTLLTSCLYMWFMVCVRGALKPVTIHHDERD